MATEVTAVIIDPIGEATLRTISSDFETYRGIIGGWIEAITPVTEAWTGYLDEEGKVHGRDVNWRATQIAQDLGWRGINGDVLVGPVMFVGPVDADGNDTSVPEAVIKRVYGTDYHQIQPTR